MKADTYTTSKTVLDKIDELENDTLSKVTELNITDEQLAKAVYNLGNRTRVAKVIRKAMSGEDIVLCTFGGSITAGAGQSDKPNGIANNFTDTMNYARKLTDWFNKTFASYGSKTTLVNAGIGATDTVYGIHRMQEDVLKYNPDLVIVEWDMNDNAENYKLATYENMLLKLLDKDIAVVMFAMCGSNGSCTQYVHEPLADYYDLPYVSYRDVFFNTSYITSLTNDTVHPNIVGHHLASLLLENYFADVYKNIETIGSTVTDNISSKTYTTAASYYDDCYIAKLSDIEDGKYENIKLVSKGSFVKNSKITQYGIRSYYGYTAKYAESYEPMVLEIKDLHTLHLLMMRSYGMSDAKFELEINGQRVTNKSFTCSHGTAGDNSQIESQYHWASELACRYENGGDITLKIYPTNRIENNYVTLFALFLS